MGNVTWADYELARSVDGWPCGMLNMKYGINKNSQLTWPISALLVISLFLSP